MIDKVLGLITVTDDGVVTAVCQFSERLVEIVYFYASSTFTLHQFGNMAWIQEGKRLTFQVTEIKRLIVAFTIHHLIVQTEDWAWIIDGILAIGWIYHHGQIGIAVQHRGGHLVPQVRYIIVFDTHTFHQLTCEFDVVTMGKSVFVYRLQWGIVSIQTNSNLICRWYECCSPHRYTA